MLFLFYKSKEIRRLSFYLNSDTLFETVSRRETIVVPNVHEFPGHIACSSLSQSEIVVPMFRDNEVYAVLDIDSKELSTFDETDKDWLEKIVRLL